VFRGAAHLASPRRALLGAELRSQMPIEQRTRCSRIWPSTLSRPAEAARQPPQPAIRAVRKPMAHRTLQILRVSSIVFPFIV